MILVFHNLSPASAHWWLPNYLVKFLVLSSFKCGLDSLEIFYHLTEFAQCRMKTPQTHNTIVILNWNWMHVYCFKIENLKLNCICHTVQFRTLFWLAPPFVMKNRIIYSFIIPSRLGTVLYRSVWYWSYDLIYKIPPFSWFSTVLYSTGTVPGPNCEDLNSRYQCMIWCCHSLKNHQNLLDPNISQCRELSNTLIGERKTIWNYSTVLHK